MLPDQFERPQSRIGVVCKESVAVSVFERLARLRVERRLDLLRHPLVNRPKVLEHPIRVDLCALRASLDRFGYGANAGGAVGSSAMSMQVAVNVASTPTTVANDVGVINGGGRVGTGPGAGE